MKRDVGTVCLLCESVTVFAANADHPRSCAFCEADLGAPLPAILQSPPTLPDGRRSAGAPELDWLE
jgi:hypothetical protein